MVNKNMPIGAAIAALKKEAAERLSAASILEAVTAGGSSEAAPVVTDRPRRRGRPRGEGVAHVAVEILREAGRPLHGLTEIVPALEARGIKLHPSGLPTTLMRSGEIVRVAPGTFGLRDGIGQPSAPAATKELRADA